MRRQTSVYRPAARLSALVATLTLTLALAPHAVWAADAQPGQQAAAVARQGGPDWNSLSAAQKSALAPLQRDWTGIEPSSKAKWIEVATRFPALSAAERQRVQDRMAEWTRMTPTQRTQARLQFQEARQVSPEDRQAKWQAYQALPEEQRRELADRAKPASGKPGAPPGADARSAASSDSKRNIVQTPRAPTVKPVNPTVVQAKPGATTTLMSSPAQPPVHHQPGLPKIAATEVFVNPSTLLPKRGPQGAAVQPSASQPAATR